MNVNIVKLANQADVTFDWDPGTDGPEVYFDRQEQFEAFAVSIVNKCLAICKDTAEKDSSLAGAGAEVCYNKILAHFGVEQ